MNKEMKKRFDYIAKKIKPLQKESDKHYKFIANFVRDYCKDDKEKVEFFRHLNEYLEAEMELEEGCGLRRSFRTLKRGRSL